MRRNKIKLRPTYGTLICLLLLGFFTTSCLDTDKNDKEDDVDTKEAMEGEAVNLKLVWEDNFNGASLNGAYWNRQIEPAGRFNKEWQRYVDAEENAYVKDGKLILSALHKGESHTMDAYTSARLNTAGKFSFKYGKVQARIKLPTGHGIWPAFWMLGANIDENGGDTPWPQCGEIDILELYGSKDAAVVEANAHFSGDDGNHDNMGGKAFKLEKGTYGDDSHVFELDWTKERLQWSVDDTIYATFPITEDYLSEFQEEFFLLLNVAVGGEWAGRPNASTGFPQEMVVDWIRVYQ